MVKLQIWWEYSHQLLKDDYSLFTLMFKAFFFLHFLREVNYLAFDFLLRFESWLKDRSCYLGTPVIIASRVSYRNCYFYDIFSAEKVYA